ncbi:MAG: TRAP transporter small permease [Tropicimonas sp.]|uniref:TRAP transporter small permease n=1 Tax=Tropicimonas sp. TaxID=2067044 RepID=UPI003A871D0F
MMHLFERVMNCILFALLALMIAFVTLQVVNRYVFQFSIPWTEELTRTLYILLIFIGSALATWQGNHVRVLTGVRRLPLRARRALAVFGALASAIFFGFVTYGFYIYMIVNWGAQYTTVLWLNVGHITAIILAASALTAGLFFAQAFRRDADFEGTEGDRE